MNIRMSVECGVIRWKTDLRARKDAKHLPLNLGRNEYQIEKFAIFKDKNSDDGIHIGI